LWVAVIGLTGVLVGALIAGWLAARRERTARREESQRSALYDLQEAALALRRALSAYDSARPKTTRALDEATGRLEVLKHRILCETVRDRVDAWRPLAVGYYSGDPAVSISQEEAAWDQLQVDVGVELRRLA